MNATVQFTVPLSPPSVNHYVKHARNGRHYVSKEALSFKGEVARFARGQKIRANTYGVEIMVYLRPMQRGDVDNFAKCVLDGLVDAEVIDSDAKVDVLILSKQRDTESRTRIRVWSTDLT